MLGHYERSGQQANNDTHYSFVVVFRTDNTLFNYFSSNIGPLAVRECYIKQEKVELLHKQRWGLHIVNA